VGDGLRKESWATGDPRCRLGKATAWHCLAQSQTPTPGRHWKGGDPVQNSFGSCFAAKYAGGLGL